MLVLFFPAFALLVFCCQFACFVLPFWGNNEYFTVSCRRSG